MVYIILKRKNNFKINGTLKGIIYFFTKLVIFKTKSLSYDIL